MTYHYTIDGTTVHEVVHEDDIEEYSCYYCQTDIRFVPCRILREDAYGNYFCEDKECVWGVINDCYSVEITSVIEVGGEEE